LHCPGALTHIEDSVNKATNIRFFIRPPSGSAGQHKGPNEGAAQSRHLI
jgi:hypothetical protein